MLRFVSDLRLLGALGLVGVVASVSADPMVVRPWVAAVSAVVGWVFLFCYGRKNWRSTYPGRAAMFMSVSVTLLLTNAAAVLWWPGDGYPDWDRLTTLLYVGVGSALLYKLGALFDSYDDK